MILHDFEVIGPIARTIADAATLLAIMAGPDPRDRASLAFGAFEPDLAADPGPQRVLFVPRFGDSPVDPEIMASVRQAAESSAALGHEIEEGEAPFDVDALNRTWPVISQAGLAWLLHGAGDARNRAGKAFQEMAATGAQLSAMDYVDALNAVRRLYAAMGETFARHDFVLTPSAAALPWPAPETHPPTIENRPVGPRGHAVFTAFANASGCPGINIPCAPSRGGLPIGFQLVGPFGADERLLQIAAQYERAHPWAHRWPALAEGTAGLETA